MGQQTLAPDGQPVLHTRRDLGVHRAGDHAVQAYGGGLLADTLLVGSGILVLGLVAWLAEWRSRKD